MPETHNQSKANAVESNIPKEAYWPFGTAYGATRKATEGFCFKSPADFNLYRESMIAGSGSLAVLNPDGTRNSRSEEVVRTLVARGIDDAVNGRISTLGEIFPA